MNTRQILVVKFGIAAAVIMCVAPPWQASIDAKVVQTRRPLGYSLIFDPPGKDLENFWAIQIDYGRLALQLLVASIAAAGGILIFRDAKERSSPTKEQSHSHQNQNERLLSPSQMTNSVRYGRGGRAPLQFATQSLETSGTAYYLTQMNLAGV